MNTDKKTNKKNKEIEHHVNGLVTGQDLVKIRNAQELQSLLVINSNQSAALWDDLSMRINNLTSGPALPPRDYEDNNFNNCPSFIFFFSNIYIFC